MVKRSLSEALVVIGDGSGCGIGGVGGELKELHSKFFIRRIFFSVFSYRGEVLDVWRPII